MNEKELKVEPTHAIFVLTEFVKKLEEWCEQSVIPPYVKSEESTKEIRGDIQTANALLAYAKSLIPKSEVEYIKNIREQLERAKELMEVNKKEFDYLAKK